MITIKIEILDDKKARISHEGAHFDIEHKHGSNYLHMEDDESSTLFSVFVDSIYSKIGELIHLSADYSLLDELDMITASEIAEDFE